MTEKVAECVLGAKFLKGMPQRPPDDGKIFWSRFEGGGDSFCVIGEVCDNIFEDGKPIIIWQPYSPESDLREAFEVVEKMRSDGWNFSCCTEDKLWQAVFDLNDTVHHAEESTLPMAIVHAAVKAREGER